MKVIEDLENITLHSELAKYIYAIQTCVKDVRENLDNYRFNDAANTLYSFGMIFAIGV